MKRILQGSGDYRIALMCAKREPLDCQRTILVSPVLVERGVMVEHILSDNRLESHDKTMKRLLDRHGLEQEDLLRSYEERVVNALRRQEAKMVRSKRIRSDE